MIRLPLAPLRLTDYTRLSSPLSPHKKKSGSSSSSSGCASSRTSSLTSSLVAATACDDASRNASTSTSGTRLSTRMMTTSLLPSPFSTTTTTTTTTPPVSRSSTEAGGPLKTLYEAPPRLLSSSSVSAAARAMAHEDEQADEEEEEDDDDDDDDDSPDYLVTQTTRAATTPPRRLMDLFLSSAAKDSREPTSGLSRSYSPRSPQARSRTGSEPVHLSPSRSRNAAPSSASASGTTPTKDEEITAAPTWSFYEDPVEPTPVASTTSNGAHESILDPEGDQVEYHDENMKPSPTSLARQLRRRSLAPVEAPRPMPSPTSMSFPTASVPQAQVAPPSTPPPTSLESNEIDTTTNTTAIPVSPPSIFPTWDPIEDSTKRQSFFGDTGNHSFDSRISSSHGFDDMGRKRSGLGEEEMLDEVHEGKRMRLSSE